MPFEKGNNANPNGRPKKEMAFSTYFTKHANKIATTKDGIVTTNLEIVIETVFRKAIGLQPDGTTDIDKADITAAKVYIEHNLGKPIQKTVIAPEEGYEDDPVFQFLKGKKVVETNTDNNNNSNV